MLTKEFLKVFNSNVVSKEFLDDCKHKSKLFKVIDADDITVNDELMQENVWDKLYKEESLH